MTPLERQYDEGMHAALWPRVPTDVEAYKYASWHAADSELTVDVCRGGLGKRERTWVYRLRSVMDDKICYVGVARDLQRRLDQHRYTKDWWEAIHNVSAQLHCCRPHALQAEEFYIRYLQPEHNIQHNTGHASMSLFLRTQLAVFEMSTDGVFWVPDVAS